MTHEAPPYGIHWFRRDLRVTGNPALQWNHKHHSGRVVGLFCFDTKFLSRSDFSAHRFRFFLRTLQYLVDEMRSIGSDVLFLDRGPFEALPQLLDSLRATPAGPPGAVSWNRDYEPFARERDTRVQRLLGDQGIRWHTEGDHLLIEPTAICKEQDPSSGYQVYTPFSRKWNEILASDAMRERLQGQRKCLDYLSDNRRRTSRVFNLTWKDLHQTDQGALASYERRTAAQSDLPLPDAGSRAALRALQQFEHRIDAYGTQRDLPAIQGTSQLSIYLKNGSLTVAQIVTALDLKPDRKGQSTGRGKFLSELIWREFYYHILWRHPTVEHHAFQARFEDIPWTNREDWFAAWTEGQTGYPIVDAGMRQLKQTGWMHNRVRMIVASFLTKDLLVDWRWGEAYFMKQLLDGDLAPNNGGWQWAASTGCDPQPYFRIFNPTLQSTKFDPSGAYIRKYVPELMHLDARDIHAPPLILRGSYPAPIVDHAQRRSIALKTYSTAMATGHARVASPPITIQKS